MREAEGEREVKKKKEEGEWAAAFVRAKTGTGDGGPEGSDAAETTRRGTKRTDGQRATSSSAGNAAAGLMDGIRHTP